MSNVFAYNPENVSVHIGGEVVEGFAQGTLVQVNMTAKQFNYTQGLVSGVRTYNPDKHGTITITIMQGSPTNLVLDKFLRADIDPNSVGYFPVIVFDNNATNGLTSWICRATTCWVSEYPQWSLANNPQTRTWTLETNNIDYRPLAPYRNIAQTSGASRPPQS